LADKFTRNIIRYNITQNKVLNTVIFNKGTCEGFWSEQICFYSLYWLLRN